MAFLFKSKKNHDREKEKERALTSRDGPPPTGSHPSSVTSATARLAKEEKGSTTRSTPTGSLNSLDPDAANSPDQASYPRRPPTADQAMPHQPSDLQYRNGPGPNVGNSSMSLYPWSQRLMTYTSSTSPFPRYGAAVNSTASKEGDIYVMGGLINSQTVKGDLWMIEAGGNMSCYQLATTAEGPSPRVGHSSLLVGNAFIVYGGDTKIDENDVLDETLYLLNTSTRQWSRALPAGPRPSGRYGHSLNILGSKIYIFGGQVEGYFMNDLSAFDLNQLQMANNRWEMLLPNNDGSDPAQGKVPPARTNHTMVSYNDKMYLFGGTNGFQWFNDVWCYDPVLNSWSQLDCIGYIPVEREGHAAALVDDVMYIFGGRTEEGTDLGDLAAFRITSRRWYTFQNMGPSPSPRSGHSMTGVGKSIIVLGGEPSSTTTPVNDLSIAYVLDTAKIRYPNDSQIPSSSKTQTQRRPSQTDGSRNLQSREGPPNQTDAKRLIGAGAIAAATTGSAAVAANASANGFRSPNGSDLDSGARSASPATSGSRLPRAANVPTPPAGPPPQGQPPKPSAAAIARVRNNSSERADYVPSPVQSNSSQNQPILAREVAKEVDSPTINGTRANATQPTVRAVSNKAESTPPPVIASAPAKLSDTGAAATAAVVAAGAATVAATAPRSVKANRQRGQSSVDSLSETAIKHASITNHRPSSPPPPTRQGGGINPLARRSSSRNSQTVALLKELDSARNRNAWYASELELARKAGYAPNATLNPVLDTRATETFDEDDKPLIEALLVMRAELANVQGSVDKQAILAAKQIAEAERQRDAAIQEAVYAKAKLAAHIGNNSANSTPQTDNDVDADGRSDSIGHKLARALNTQKDLQGQLERTTTDIEAEKRARLLADDTLQASQRRMAELEAYKQQTSYEMERLKAELHSAQREAREHSVTAAEAVAAAQMLRVTKDDFERQYNEAAGHVKEKGNSFESLRDALAASTDIKTHLEEKLEQERAQRESAEAKLVSIKQELESRTAEVVTLSQRLRDAEEVGEKHANEARTHRLAVLNGLNTITTRDISTKSNKTDMDRIAALVSQLDTAKALLKKHQQDADTASDRLRSAEERIAGLEAYQEQSSREGVSIRRQLQTALRDTQTLQAHNTDLKHQLTAAQMETNAVTVQHNTLKDILTERGISPSGSSRTRGSPGEGTSGHEVRVRSLEQQLATSMAAHEETKQVFATQASESETAYRDKLSQLENDYQSAVHYVKGTEKMLKQLKEQLNRYKQENTRLKTEVEELEEKGGNTSRGIGGAGSSSAPSDWESERGALSKKIELLQGDMLTTKGQLEKQVQMVRQEMEEAKRERDIALRSSEETVTRLTTSRRDFDQLQQENAQLERRAQDAEQKVSLLLDQVESSVDNYRRRSRQVASISPDQFKDAMSNVSTSTTTNGNGSSSGVVSGGAVGSGHTRQESSEAGSAYGGSLGDARNSAALDNLANELETLRSHWEATNKNYRLSNAFDFETGGQSTTGTVATGKENSKDDGGSGLSASLADWRKRLDG